MFRSLLSTLLVAPRSRADLVLESAKLSGQKPQEYVIAATRFALENPGSAVMPYEMR